MFESEQQIYPSVGYTYMEKTNPMRILDRAGIDYAVHDYSASGKIAAMDVAVYPDSQKVGIWSPTLNKVFRLADKAARSGRSVRLEPMNPYERKVIHTALQQRRGVTTRSEGE